MLDTAVAMDSGLLAEPVIGPATSGRTRWLGPGMTALELHLRRLCFGLAVLAEVEEFLRRETERRGKERGGKPLDAGVVFLHGIVEEAPCCGDLVLKIGQLRLQLLEIGTG